MLVRTSTPSEMCLQLNVYSYKMSPLYPLTKPGGDGKAYVGHDSMPALPLWTAIRNPLAEALLLRGLPNLWMWSQCNSVCTTLSKLFKKRGACWIMLAGIYGLEEFSLARYRMLSCCCKCHSLLFVYSAYSIPRDQLDHIPPDAEEKAFGNSVYKITFEDRPDRPVFGHKYWFYLQDAVENVPEYIVRWENFVQYVLFQPSLLPITAPLDSRVHLYPPIEWQRNTDYTQSTKKNFTRSSPNTKSIPSSSHS